MMSFHFSFILEKVHKEFDELMFTKKEGRMLEQLTVRDYDLGTSLPLLTTAGTYSPSPLPLPSPPPLPSSHETTVLPLQQSTE